MAEKHFALQLFFFFVKKIQRLVTTCSVHVFRASESQKNQMFMFIAEPHSSVSSVPNFSTGGRFFDSPARPIFIPRIDNSHCKRIHTSLTTVHCFNNGYVEKCPVAWREYCGRRDITEILL